MAYWAAVAQIIPVLAIPLVIEARLVARRLSASQDEFSRRSRRLTWGVVFSILAVGMFGTEAVAVTAILFGRVDGFAYWLAVYVILGALFVVFTVPLSAITSTLVTDILWIGRARLPWGRLKRLRRDAESLAEDVRRSRRRNADVRFKLLMTRARTLLASGDMARAVVGRLVEEGQLPANKAEEITSAAIGRAFEKFDGSFSDSQGQYASLKQEMDLIEELHDTTLAALELIIAQTSERIRTGAPAGDIEQLRARLRRVSGEYETHAAP
ncbi:hypothetical protein [Microbacterium sp. Bi128]|uniref:hypothetical protein n=1 Tax=Microbacterium sp. Bi128 TaxID=2821115 RepID=UPI001DCFD9A2|nr:hypothetical protein [Microbacterium sp. Bi128]CAH0227645.1 hypothetical protein SRABI128_02357 [Microbacterium sp. Bi128]